jgi:hypothetical protein
MKLHPIAACFTLFALCGCATVSDVFSADEKPAPVRYAETTQASGFTPVAYTAQASNFCVGVAANDRARGLNAGFDTATLDRITLQSFQQCSMLAGSPSPAGAVSQRLALR